MAAVATLCAPKASARAPPPAAPRARTPADCLRSSAAAAAAGVLLLFGAPAAHAVDFVFASPAAVEGLARRDEAMQFKCKGGMMDCDGDRRDYARKQGENLAKRAAGELKGDTACKVEEACTSNILGAAVSGLSGLTTGDKLAQMGRDPTTMVNSTSYDPEAAAASAAQAQ